MLPLYYTGGFLSIPERKKIAAKHLTFASLCGIMVTNIILSFVTMGGIKKFWRIYVLPL